MVKLSNPRAARVGLTPALDIPQWAKDEGHNGSVTWSALVGPDGKPRSLTLKKSSNSVAIDAAAKAIAERANYSTATDAVGQRIDGVADLRMSYARHDRRNPGGGLADYRCADLTREADWFAKANAGTRVIFWPENAFTSLPGLRQMQGGVITTPATREASYRQRGKEWQRLLARCRKTPETLFLDLVDDREFYRQIADSF